MLDRCFMFGLFKGKTPSSPPPPEGIAPPAAPAPGPAAAAAPATAAAPTLDPLLPGLVMQELLGALARGNRFQGGCDRLPGWRVQTMPDGIEVAHCRAHLAGAFLAERQAVLMFAGLDAARTAMVSLGAVLAHHLKAEPAWQTDAAGAWIGAVPVAPGMVMAFELKNAPVDPLSTGKTVAGLQMVVRIARG